MIFRDREIGVRFPTRTENSYFFNNVQTGVLFHGKAYGGRFSRR